MSLCQHRQEGNELNGFCRRHWRLLHFGDHKGFGLGLLCDILAGVFCGAPCSHPQSDQVANAMLTILLKPDLFADEAGFGEEVSSYLT